MKKSQNRSYSSVNKLGQMIDRTNSRKKKTSSPLSKVSLKTDALLDMIDQRIGNLLVRSSEIESKLDALENGQNSYPLASSSKLKNSTSPSSTLAPPKKSTSPPKPTKEKKEDAYSFKKTSKSQKSPQNDDISLTETKVKQPTINFHKSLPNISSVTTDVRNDSNEIYNTILQAIQNLGNEIHEIKKQQAIMQTQIIEIHKAIFVHEENIPKVNEDVK